MSRISLAVDLDGITFDYTAGLRKFLKEEYGREGLHDPQFYSYVESGWFKDLEDFKKIHGEAVENGLYANMSLIPGSAQTLRELSENGYAIHILTSRFVNPGQHQKVVSDTSAALDKNNIPYYSISFLNDKTRFRADSYIDDSPFNITELEKINAHVLTFSQDYNKGVGKERVSTWKEIRDIFKHRYNK
jgi:5'(3')-deoxyribonucleotidase